MMENGYKFQFLGILKTNDDPYQIDSLTYTFVSLKSGHRYQVIIERYANHLNCIKFYDESTDLVKGRFSGLSGTYEPRTIFRTVAEIALDALRRDPEASFFFVGAADEKDHTGKTNCRYRVYTAFLKDLGIGKYFRPVYLDDQSACILVNIKAVPDIKEYVLRVYEFFAT